MQKKKIIGILLLLIINLMSSCLICLYPVGSFGIIVVPVGDIQAKIVEAAITKDSIQFLILMSSVSLCLNYLIFKKLVGTKRYIVSSFVLSAIGVVAFIPFYFSAKNSFVAYQKGTVVVEMVRGSGLRETHTE